nr:non-structural protein NS2b [Rio Bravo virus]
ATDYTAILGIVMAIGAAICKNGLESSGWMIGIMGIFLVFFLLQLSKGEMTAEWAGYCEWKKDCDKSVGSLSLEVKRMSDGRLVNLSKDKESMTEVIMVSVGMIVTGFHWIGIPLTIAMLGIKKCYDATQR